MSKNKNISLKKAKSEIIDLEHKLLLKIAEVQHNLTKIKNETINAKL
jgi:hypothetical protein